VTQIDNSGPFRFTYWPFSIVPRPGQDLVWADRANLKTQISRLARTLGRHDSVSLHLLWADFGAGKTHTLFYLKQEAEKGAYGSLLPLYSALPKGCRSFLDIYRAMVRAIPLASLRDAYKKAETSIGRDELSKNLSDIWMPLPRCFAAIGILGEEQQLLALAWLQAESTVSTRQLHELSLVGRIKSTDDAVLALCGIVRLFNLAGHQRVLLMVDEFQRLEILRRQQQDDINAGLHGFFNACDHGMSLLLSFSFGAEENIRHFLNAELLSRVHPLRISIPTLTYDDGIAFLNDVIEHARDTGYRQSIRSEVVTSIVDAVSKKFELTPRRLLKAGGLVFESAALDLEDGNIDKLEPSYVDQMVERGDFRRLDDQEEVE